MIQRLKKVRLHSSSLHSRFTRPTASIVAIYTAFTNNQVKSNSRVSLVPCCFHSEHTPSLALYPATNSFYCFGCRVHGDSLDFILLMEHCSYQQALAILKTYGY